MCESVTSLFYLNTLWGELKEKNEGGIHIRVNEEARQNMTSIEWTVKSRYNTPRCFTYFPEKGEVVIVCKDVLYVSYSTGKYPDTQAELLVAVDPDGGPYLGKGTRLYPPEPSALKIVSILEENYDRSKKRLTVKVTVESFEP